MNIHISIVNVNASNNSTHESICSLLSLTVCKFLVSRYQKPKVYVPDYHHFPSMKRKHPVAPILSIAPWFCPTHYCRICILQYQNQNLHTLSEFYKYWEFVVIILWLRTHQPMQTVNISLVQLPNLRMLDLHLLSIQQTPLFWG